MKMLRGVAAAAVLAGASMGAAPAALADTPVMEGTYNYVSEGQSGTWTIYPICTNVVGDLREPLYLPVGCTLHVAPSAGITGGDARLVGGLWSFTTPKKKGMQCSDGTWGPTVEEITFNETSGTRRITQSGARPFQP